MHYRKLPKILAVSMVALMLTSTTAQAASMNTSSSSVITESTTQTTSGDQEDGTSGSDTSSSSSSSSSEDNQNEDDGTSSSSSGADENTSSDSSSDSSSSSSSSSDSSSSSSSETSSSSSATSEEEDSSSSSSSSSASEEGASEDANPGEQSNEATSQPVKPDKDTANASPEKEDNKTAVEEKDKEDQKAEAEKAEEEKEEEEEEEKDTSETEDEKRLGDVDKKEREQAKEESEKKPEEERTNEALLKSQNIEEITPIELDWRMARIEAKGIVAKEQIAIRDEMDKKSKVVGLLPENGIAYLLSEEEDGWLYIESGTVRGFAKAERFLVGKEADKIINNVPQKVEPDTSGIVIYEEKELPKARGFCWPEQNKAFGYKNITTQDVVCTRKGITKNQLAVFESRSLGARKVGQLKKDNLVYILKDYSARVNGQHWLFIESGDVRGFVIDMIDEEKEIADADIEKYETAEPLVEREENAAWWASIQSIKEGNPESQIRQQILEYAQQFVGNRYIWGGNDPHIGADCSGFVKYVYAHFGITLPRVADDQSRFGKQIRIQDASPGDLVFWAENGYVYHVAMYAGNGETIEAHSSAAGIVHIKRNINNCVWATRLL